MTNKQFDKLVTADIMRLQGKSEEEIINFLTDKKTIKVISSKPEIHPFKDDKDIFEDIYLNI